MTEKLAHELDKDIRFLIANRFDFKVVTSQTTLIVKYGKEVNIYLDAYSGISNSQSFVILALIAKVKSDCNKYLKRSLDVSIEKASVSWAVAMTNRPVDITGTIYKVDIRSAYWQSALELGVISQPTYEYYKEKEGMLGSHAKLARLKALGTLASIKTVREYKKGEMLNEYQTVNIESREVYMRIAQKVDLAMKYIAETVGGVLAYYHDCIFLSSEENIQIVKDILLVEGFQSKLDGKFTYIASPSPDGEHLHYITTNVESGEEANYVFNKFNIKTY